MNLLNKKKQVRLLTLQKKIYISVRHIYNIIERLRELDAPIAYNRKSKTYHYTAAFDLVVTISVQVHIDDKLKTIYSSSSC